MFYSKKYGISLIIVYTNEIFAIPNETKTYCNMTNIKIDEK